MFTTENCHPGVSVELREMLNGIVRQLGFTMPIYKCPHFLTEHVEQREALLNGGRTRSLDLLPVADMLKLLDEHTGQLPYRLIHDPDEYGPLGESMPYLQRLYLGSDEKEGWNAYLHIFGCSDSRDPHNHPWRWAVGIPLVGGYEEHCVTDTTFMDVVANRRERGQVGLITQNDYHRVEILPEMTVGNFVVTLFITDNEYPYGWSKLQMTDRKSRGCYAPREGQNHACIVEQYPMVHAPGNSGGGNWWEGGTRIDDVRDQKYATADEAFAQLFSGVSPFVRMQEAC